MTCTANDLQPFGEAAGFDPPVHRWDADERAKLLAELDAAFFVLYGIGREDVEFILGTFAAFRAEEEAPPQARFAADQILEAYKKLMDP